MGEITESIEPSATIPREVLLALCVAQRAAKAVGKTSTNKFHNYRYASADAIVEEAREAFHAANLCLVTESWRTAIEEDGPWLSVYYLLVHAGSGATWRLPMHRVPMVQTPEKNGGKKALDKTEATALTYSLGYVLRGLLLLVRTDDSVEMDQRKDGDEEDDGPPTFEAALRATKDVADLRRLLWRFREKIAEDFSRERGGPLIRAAYEAHGAGALSDKAIASIWGESGASSQDGAPSGDRG